MSKYQIKHVLLELQFWVSQRIIMNNEHMHEWRIWHKIFKCNCRCQIKVFPSRVYKCCRIIIEINKNHEVTCQFFSPSKWISCVQVLFYPSSEFNCFSTKLPQLSLWITWLTHHIWWSSIYNSIKHSIKSNSSCIIKRYNSLVHSSL